LISAGWHIHHAKTNCRPDIGQRDGVSIDARDNPLEKLLSRQQRYADNPREADDAPSVGSPRHQNAWPRLM
jgi:hypothetical protein